MKLKNYFLIVLAFSFSQMQAQWSVVDSINSGNLYAIHFLNVDTGFTFHEFGTLRRTADGGQTWDSVNAPFTGFVFDFAFPTQSVGYAVGGAWFPFANYYSNSIMKTLDGGVTWDSVLGDHTGGVFTGIHAVSPLEYYATGDRFILHSTDGGATHHTLNPSAVLNTSYGKVEFATATTGYVLAGDYLAGGIYISNLFKTADAGQSWQSVYTDTLKNGLQDFVITPTGEIYIIGEKGYIVKSASNGTGWQRLAMADTSLFFNKLAFNDGKLYAIGTNPKTSTTALFKSTDEGINWQVEIAHASSFASFNDMSFPSAVTGYMISGRKVYKNTKLISLIEAVNGGFQLYPNPASDVVSLKLTDAGAATVTVYNSVGQRVMELATDGRANFELNVSSLKPGLYLIELQHGGARLVERLIRK